MRRIIWLLLGFALAALALVHGLRHGFDSYARDLVILAVLVAVIDRQGWPK